jgi:dipeptidyl aminopeptidase/acylaminoacyl peptidase
LSFSPDGKWLAFTMPVDYEAEKMGEIPVAPEGAEWAKPVIVETRYTFRADGVGYLPFSSHQVFLIPTEGGASQQLTNGKQDHYSPLTWLPDSSALLLSINIKNAVNKPLDSDIVRLDIKTRQLSALATELRQDLAPQISPDGKRMAWIGNDDRPGLAHLFTRQKVYTAKLDGSDVQQLTSANDLGVKDFSWHQDSRKIYIQFEERGKEALALLAEDGTVTKLTDELSGWELDQPYVMGQFSASAGLAAFTQGNSTTPTELAVVDSLGNVKVLTDLNRSLHNSVQFSTAQEYSVKSSFDKREIQYWVMLPPNFDANKSYPMILQIHGGPWASYGPLFAANNQLYAAAGYVVVYGNPRGSTGYGPEFAEIIDNNYPSQDYDDLMDIVDSALKLGFIDENKLFVTGGSGGGVLTAWIVGKTKRFKAAVSVNPVINAISAGLLEDINKMSTNYWYADYPWNDPMKYWSHSALSLVGNVTTPTMIITGEEDWRTPISESEQFYNALQIEDVETALVRVPGASHWIEARPSQLIAKVNAILAWFERYDKPAKSATDK